MAKRSDQKPNVSDAKGQVERFREAARNLGTDESEEAFDRALKKIGSAPPAPVQKQKKTAAKTAKRS